MASNRELATRARELGRARGIDVDTRGLDNAGLTTLVERLEAEAAEPGAVSAAAGETTQVPPAPALVESLVAATPPIPNLDKLALSDDERRLLSELAAVTDRAEKAEAERDAARQELESIGASRTALVESVDRLEHENAELKKENAHLQRFAAGAPRRLGLIVAPNRAALCSRGVHLQEGEEVQQGDFDEPTLRRLVAMGTLIDEP